MEFITVGILCIVMLLFFLAAGLPVGLTFITSGLISSYLLIGAKGSITMLGQVAFHSIEGPTWACIPLFILMGAFATSGGFARRAYQSMNVMAARLPGSLAIATCFACAAFGAISGSSIATTAIFGKLALPEMDRHGYDKALSVGCIAAAGTFASMIPPSMMFIIYALFTQQSVAKLFAAGIVPGLITAVVYSGYIILKVRKNPECAPRPSQEILDMPLPEKVRESFQIWPIVLIAVCVLGGMYSGIFTPTEAAAAGSLLTLILGWQQKEIKDMNMVIGAMKMSANTTAMIFLINIGALYYSRILAMTRVPTELTSLLNSYSLPSWVILSGIMLILFFLGMIMVPIGIYTLTLPIVFPIIMDLGYDPIWFGVLVMKLTEIGAITPPVGLNAYALKGAVGKDVGLEQIFKGIGPFCICDVIVLVFLVLFPQLSLWLPNLLLG